MLTKTELDLNDSFILESKFIQDAQEFLRENWALLESRDFSTLYDRAWSELNMSTFIVMNRHLMLCGIDTLPYVDKIPNHFLAWSNIKEFDIPNHITSIGNSAFYECEKLERVAIPNSVKSIEYDAFGFCESLESVVIPSSVTTIEDYVFGDCKNLESVSISKKFVHELDRIFSGVWSQIKFTYI